MRLRAIAFALLAFGAATGAAWQAGVVASDLAEDRSAARLTAALETAGHAWASVTADGLVVTLTGTAPDEAARFHAVEAARRALVLGRIDDRTGIAGTRPLVPPGFAVEILRSDDNISLVGLVPDDGTREAVVAAIADAGTATDMLEVADHPAPPAWEATVAFGLDVLALLPRAQIELAPGRVTVTAVTEDEEERAALARQLRDDVPDDVALALDLRAPRPVLSPFTFAFRQSPDEGAFVEACSAESDEDAAAILEAAGKAGAAAKCRIGLGAPTSDWAAAVRLGIAAVTRLGGGSFALNDMEAVLVGPPTVAPDRLAEIGAGLDEALPKVFTVSVRGGAPIEAPEDTVAIEEPRFRALLAEGMVQLTGPITNRTAEIAIRGFAEAIFGHEKVASTTIILAGLPEGWPMRILTAIEALAILEEGEVEVTPGRVTVSGRSLKTEPERALRTFFAEKDAGEVVLDVTYDAKTAAVRAEAERPREEVCAERVTEILDGEMITFASGSAGIVEESGDVIAALAEALQGCPGAHFEVAGHTDASGNTESNQKLSEDRAAAVAEALQDAGAFLVTLEPKGYGPDRPVADNDTEEGRARNRRIEFALRRDGPQAAKAAADADDEAPAANAGAEVGDSGIAEEPMDAEQPEETGHPEDAAESLDSEAEPEETDEQD